jgi:homoserine O-acetyltransferase/O-succinyltransferase
MLTGRGGQSGAEGGGDVGESKSSKLLWQRVDYPAPKEGNWVGPNVRFPSAEVVPPSPGVEPIKAAILAIPSADDERNPPETGIMERERTRLSVSKDMPRHLTTGLASFCKQWSQEPLQTSPVVVLLSPGSLFRGPRSNDAN